MPLPHEFSLTGKLIVQSKRSLRFWLHAGLYSFDLTTSSIDLERVFVRRAILTVPHVGFLSEDDCVIELGKVLLVSAFYFDCAVTLGWQDGTVDRELGSHLLTWNLF